MSMSKTRKEYVSMIWQYRKRRDALNQKIQTWVRELKRIDAKNEKALFLIREVNQYFNVEIQVRCNKPQYVLARNCYYKYGMEEMDLRGLVLAKTLGNTYRKRASESRLRFTRSFRVNLKNKEAYHSFKRYIESK